MTTIDRDDYIRLAQPGEFPELEEVRLATMRQRMALRAGGRIMRSPDEEAHVPDLHDPLEALLTAPASGYPDAER